MDESNMVSLVEQFLNPLDLSHTTFVNEPIESARKGAEERGRRFTFKRTDQICGYRLCTTKTETVRELLPKPVPSRALTEKSSRCCVSVLLLIQKCRPLLIKLSLAAAIIYNL